MSDERCWYSDNRCYVCSHAKECAMRIEYLRRWKEHMDSAPSWEWD